MNVRNYSNVVAIGIDGAGLSKAFSILEINDIGILRSEQGNTLQELNRKEKENQGYETWESYFCFARNFHEWLVLYFLMAW